MLDPGVRRGDDLDVSTACTIGHLAWLVRLRQRVASMLHFSSRVADRGFLVPGDLVSCGNLSWLTVAGGGFHCMKKEVQLEPLCKVPGKP
jgi:hypothetical protein